MNNNGRPLSKKQTIRLLIALMILFWATQTMLKEWGYGQELQAMPTTEPAESFVPANPAASNGATLELRSEATVIGSDVKLRQVCRWSDADKSLFDPIGDLVLAHLSQPAPFKAMTLQEIRGILSGAGVNVAVINFAGATSCTISRSDVEYDEHQALQQWIDAKQQAAATTQPSQTVVVTTPPATAPQADEPIKTLHDRLVDDLAMRLNVSADTLQVSFKGTDEHVLNVTEPPFKFQIDPVRAKFLGVVCWTVTIVGSDNTKQRATITGEAKAWQNQIVAAKPLGFGQMIRPDDVTQRRTLVDQLSDDPLLTMEQVVGQQTARELKPGMVFTARMIDPAQLVKTGQFVTVTLEQGTVKIRTVAKAMENGIYGQTIRVKNETTNEIYQVNCTGPQTATMNLGSSVASAGQPNNN